MLAGLDTPEELHQVLRDFAADFGITEQQAIAALNWVSRPLIRPQVSVREFLESPHYMGTKREDGTSILYPEVVNELEKMNSGDYSEVVLTGSIGCAKTTCALYSVAYQLYLLSLYENPHEEFGLDPSSEIVFIFQSLSADAARLVDYSRFKAMIDKSPYFRDYFPYDKDTESELKFPHRIYARPVSGKDTAAIGQNVIGGLMDEVNYMTILDKSRRSATGGAYDQAAALYDSISRRRKNRFAVAGKVPGLLCLVSSKRYPGQFTDRKTQEAIDDVQRDGYTRTYVYDKRSWDIKPAKFFMPTTFRMFIGDTARKPRMLEPGDVVSEEDQKLVMEIPDDFKSEFRRDPMGSLRDIAGVSTISRFPFIPDREAINRCMRKDHLLFEQRTVDFVEQKLTIDPTQMEHKEFDRFVHIDLAVNRDAAGFAMGCVPRFVPIERGDEIELMPFVYLDAVLQIVAPRGGEILFYKLRELVYTLKRLGYKVRWASFDQFQSRDSLQLLRQKGIAVGIQSIDLSSAPYDFLKHAFYDGRVSSPIHPLMAFELLALEKNQKTGKIDHPAGGSKDVADAAAGVVYGLTMRRETWATHGIAVGSIPDSIKELIAKRKEDAKAAPSEPDAIRVTS